MLSLYRDNSLFNPSLQNDRLDLITSNLECFIYKPL